MHGLQSCDNGFDSSYRFRALRLAAGHAQGGDALGRRCSQEHQGKGFVHNTFIIGQTHYDDPFTD